jgi:hypothetical protein
VTALLHTAAAWIGDTAARIAIRIGAGVQLAAALGEAWAAAEPESPLTWEKPAPRFDTRKVWLVADKASVDRADTAANQEEQNR